MSGFGGSYQENTGDAAALWERRNRQWAGMTPGEREAYVCGQLNAYEAMFCAFHAAFKTGQNIDTVFEAVRALYDIEHDRATVAGVL